MYSTLSASYLGSLSFRKRNWGLNVPKLFKNKTQDWLLAQSLLLRQLSSTLMFEIFILITLLRFAAFNFLIRVHDVDFSIRDFIWIVILQKGEWINRQLNQPTTIYLKPENIFCKLDAWRFWCLVFILGGLLGSCVCGFFCCFFVLGFLFVCLNMKERTTLINLVAHKHQHRQKFVLLKLDVHFATTLFSKGQDIQRTRTNHYSVHICQMG